MFAENDIPAVTVPAGISEVVVQVHNGADDAGGGRAVEVTLTDPNGKKLLSTLAGKYSWEGFRSKVSIQGQYIVMLRDLDTSVSGTTAPGNSGSLKIVLK